MAVKKGGLGKGLGSLMAENATDDNLTAELRLSEIEIKSDLVETAVLPSCETTPDSSENL